MVSVLRPGTFQAVDLTEPSPSNNLNKTSSSEGPNVLDLSRTRDAVAHQVDRSKRSRTQISSAYLRPKVDEKAAGRHKWRGQAETGGGGSRKLWTPPRRELAATTLQMHSPVDSNSIRLPVFSPLLSPVAQ